jgi:hypothetical protein
MVYVRAGNDLMRTQTYRQIRRGLASICAGALTLASNIAGQTRIDFASQGKNIDFANAEWTRPFKIGTALPATCRQGESFFRISAAGASVLHICDPANSWTPLTARATWSSLVNPAAPLSLSMGGYSTTLNFGASGAGIHAFRVTDAADNQGNGILGHFTSAPRSQMIPWQADADGVGWQVDAAGQLRSLGSNESGALTLNGSESGGCTLTVPATGGAIVPGAPAECDLGSTTAPLGKLHFAGTSALPQSSYFQLTGAATGARVWTFQDATDTVVGRATTDVLTNKTFDTTGAGNVFKINGRQIANVQGSSTTALLAGTVSGSTGTPLCTDANGNATTAGCQAGGVAGPGSTVSGNIPMWSNTTGSSLSGGLQPVTTLGNPGSNAAIPTEAAVRAAISASGGGTVSSVITGCGLSGGPITSAGTIVAAVPVVSKTADYTVASGDCGSLLSMTGTRTFSVPAASAAGIGSGWFVRLQNAGSGSVTVTTAGGAFYGGRSGSSFTLAAGQLVLLASDGSNWNAAESVVSSGGSGGGYTAGNGVSISGGNVISAASVCAAAPSGDTVTGSSDITFATGCTIAANTLSVGSVIKFQAAGTITGNYGINWQWGVKLGNTTIIPALYGTYQQPNPHNWSITGQVVVTAIGTNGAVFGVAFSNQGNYATGTGGGTSSVADTEMSASAVTIDTTAAQVLKIYYHPSGSGNTGALKFLSVQVIN